MPSDLSAKATPLAGGEWRVGHLALSPCANAELRAATTLRNSPPTFLRASNAFISLKLLSEQLRVG